MNSLRTLMLAAVIILPVTLVSGCESYFSSMKNRNATMKDIESNSDFYPEEPAAIYIDSPMFHQSAVPVKRIPGWATAKISPINASGGLPLQFLMRQLLGDTGINYIFSDEIDTNAIINVSLSGTINQALETLSTVTGLSYKLDANAVHWSSYITKTFNVSYIPGDYNYMVGSTPKESGSNGNIGGGAGSENIQFGTDAKEYSSVTGKGDDAFAEIERVTKQIVSEFGEVAASRATSSIIVTTTRARMERVNSYFTSVESTLGRQVAFEIQFVRFTSKKSGQGGIDWNYIKERASSSLIFNGGDLSSLAGGATPITFSGTVNSGSRSGSDVLLSLLEEQGVVTVSTSPRVVTQPNRVVELELSRLTGYLARTEVTQSVSAIGAEPSVALSPGVVQSGYNLFALANIGADDKIILHLSSTYTDLESLARREVMNSAIETPVMTRNRLVSTTVLRNGSTMILAGLGIDSSSDTGASPISASYLPTRKTQSSENTTTIALVTPIILNMN